MKIQLGKLSFNFDNVIYLEPSYGCDEAVVNGKFGLTGKYYPKINILAVGEEQQIFVTFRGKKFEEPAHAETFAQQLINQALTTSNL